MLRAALPLVVLLLAGCSLTAEHSVSTPTPAETIASVGSRATATASFSTPLGPSPTVSASPTPVLAVVRAWQVPPKTGVSYVDAIVAAVTTANAGALAPLLAGGIHTGPCTTPTTELDLACPPGVAVGSPTPFLSFYSGCNGGALRVDAASARPGTGGTTLNALATRIAGQPRFLWFSEGAGTSAVPHTLYFLNSVTGEPDSGGWILTVGSEGVTAHGELRFPSCGSQSLNEMAGRLARSSLPRLVPPPP